MQQTIAKQEEYQEQARQLENAFKSFSEMSENLSHFYQGVEHQVVQLRQELTQAHNEKQHQEQEKIKYANRLDHLLQILPAGVIVLDGHGYIREYNQAAKEIFQMSLEKKLWREVVENNFKPRWDDGHDITLVNGRRVNLSTQSLDSEPGQIILIKDVTETRQLQNQFSQMKRLSAMGQMAASLAHQVRTPLSSALLYASNMRRNSLETAVRERFNDKIISRLQELEKLVEDMLLFARGGRFDVKTTSATDLYSVIHESLDASYEQDEIQIQADIGDGDINVNHTAIISALENLINNALQSADDIIVEISIWTNDSQFMIEVKDSGPGIPESIHESLFEPFFSTKQKGTGLGLAVVDAVVKAHRGKLTFISKENKGSCFTMQLPLLHGTQSAKSQG